MGGYAIVVPPGPEGEKFLDLLWRITMVYAGRPSWLRSRARVSKMIEAVIGKGGRQPEPLRPARKGGKTERTQDDQLLSTLLANPAPRANAKLRKAIASLPPLRGENKAQNAKVIPPCARLSFPTSIPICWLSKRFLRVHLRRMSSGTLGILLATARIPTRRSIWPGNSVGLWFGAITTGRAATSEICGGDGGATAWPFHN